MIHPSYATLKYPKGLPRQQLKVYTVQPDQVLRPEQWVKHHMDRNKVCIQLGDHAPRS